MGTPHAILIERIAEQNQILKLCESQQLTYHFAHMIPFPKIETFPFVSTEQQKKRKRRKRRKRNKNTEQTQEEQKENEETAASEDEKEK